MIPTSPSRVAAALARHVGAGAALILVMGVFLARTAAAESPTPAAPTPAPSPTASAGAPFTPIAGATPIATPPAGPLPTLPPVPKPIVHPSDGQSNTCYDCHSAVNQTQAQISSQWADSVHGKNGVTCADCHGGDPRSDSMSVAMSAQAGFIGTPSKAVSVGVCGSCHSDAARMAQYQLATDEYAKYATSVHGQLLATGDARVAACIDCHGSHDIKKASDPTAAVYPLNVPKLCASCHANASLMQAYGIPTDQYAIYEQSVHGQALLKKADLRAPTCASCHGSHDAKPPTSSDVVDVCGKCNTATQALYEKSRHSVLDVGPKCWTCHGTHDVQPTGENRLFHPTPPTVDCLICHDPVTNTFRLRTEQFANDADRRCDTCHHSASAEYAQASGIRDALVKASTAYDDADAKLKQAAQLGMIVTDADVALTEARTDLIQARAAVHTTQLTDVAKLTDAAAAKAGEADAFADARLSESTFRREAMVAVVFLIALNILALLGVRRSIHRDDRAAEAEARSD
jgi:formate-dependent nitrite reductase cytochrome c552 subunit